MNICSKIYISIFSPVLLESISWVPLVPFLMGSLRQIGHMSSIIPLTSILHTKYHRVDTSFLQGRTHSLGHHHLRKCGAFHKSRYILLYYQMKDLQTPGLLAITDQIINSQSRLYPWSNVVKVNNAWIGDRYVKCKKVRVYRRWGKPCFLITVVLTYILDVFFLSFFRCNW